MKLRPTIIVAAALLFLACAAPQEPAPIAPPSSLAPSPASAEPATEVPHVRSAEKDARAIHAAVGRWRKIKGDDLCPTTAQLIGDRELAADARLDDPWGTPFKVECSENDARVHSAGPDKSYGTPDDIFAPRAW